MGTPHFPVHLRIIGGHSVYRIESETTFVEVQRIGTRFLEHRVIATTWPERLRIHDMLTNVDGSLAASTPAEFEDWALKAGMI